MKKPVADFTKDSTRLDGLHPSCKECKRTRDNGKYANYRVKSNARHLKYRQNMNEFITSIKLKTGCVSCGENSHPALLEFHHSDPKEKDFNVGAMRKVSDKLRTEILKCICLCANCHRKVHLGLIDGDILPRVVI